MRKSKTPLIGLVVLVGALFITYSYMSRTPVVVNDDAMTSDLLELESSDGAVPADSIHTPVEDHVAVIDTAGPTMVFQPVDEETMGRLSLWLNSEYIPFMDRAEFHIRSTLVRVNSDQLVDDFTTAYEANGGFIAPNTDLTKSDTDFFFPLFSDSDVQATLVHLKQGRHSGLTMARMRTTVNHPQTGMNTDNIYLEISASGSVSGIVDTPRGMFRIQPTPEDDVLVVSEMDSKLVYGSVNVD